MTPFVILGLQRSGTTFFRRALDDHPDIACHGELFRPGRVSTLGPPVPKGAMPDKTGRDADPVGYMDRLLSFYDQGFVGFKLLLAHSPPVLREVCERRYRLIALKRENALAKYSSLAIFLAMKGSGDRFTRPANLGPEAVKATFEAAGFERFQATEAARWSVFDAIRARCDPPLLDLDYAEISWGDGFDRALDFLGAARRRLDAGIVKQNSTDIVSRFSNPDQVRDYLQRNRLEHWGLEGPRTAMPA